MILKMKFIFVLLFKIYCIYCFILKIIFTNKALYHFLKGSLYVRLNATACKAKLKYNGQKSFQKYKA